ncbi:hypothetical protein A4A49_52685 [Nicotiana attenuata]|uniref:Retrovirus-related pol polyprotein from transposon tnt 1-94 n=1 Tax=Nicotiana attenuata TaxID=49451 RepID=A0A314KLH2_NICAT|nr:hypothetical protein A4A49_52685 [Nicotiana attenuata]
MASNTTTEIFDGVTNFGIVSTATVPAVLPDMHGVANTLLHPQLWQTLMSKHMYVNRHGYISNDNIKTFKKNAPQCKRRVGINDNLAKSKLNLTKADDTIVAVIFQINNVTNVRDWVIDSGATRHICANKNKFLSYTQIETLVLLGTFVQTKINFCLTPKLRKEKNLFILVTQEQLAFLGKEKFFSNSHLVKL